MAASELDNVEFDDDNKHSNKVSDDFFSRFLLQGKLISQLITFWWRYADDDNATEEQREAANHLGACFYPMYVDAVGDTPVTYTAAGANLSLGIGEDSPSSISLSSEAEREDKPYKPNLIHLFEANPRRYWMEGCPNPVDSKKIDQDKDGRNVKTLIAVFGAQRICKTGSKGKYLSPIFSRTELDDKGGAFYSFIIDNSGSKFGKLTDPEYRMSKHDVREKKAQEFRYFIPIPPRHLIPKNIWEEWIEEEEELYPPSPHIPFTT